MEKNKVLAIVIGVLAVVAIALGIFSYTQQMQLQEQAEKYNTLQADYEKVGTQFQEQQQEQLVFANWIEEDGYTSAEEWWKALNEIKTEYANCDKKFLETDTAQYATDEQKVELEGIAKKISGARSINDANTYKQAFENLVAQIEAQKQEALAASYQSGTEWAAVNYANYNISSNGLTPTGGVNAYGGRTETYYSSNILYSASLTGDDGSGNYLDSEGFYRTSEGYYVVAVSDMSRGTTFEGSKGTCIVQDTGCNPGVTDYYVAWG